MLFAKVIYIDPRHTHTVSAEYVYIKVQLVYYTTNNTALVEKLKSIISLP